MSGWITTLLAMLSSLQMGFRTLALEKRSSEVWQVLAAVKTEFGKFGDVLSESKGTNRNGLEDHRWRRGQKPCHGGELSKRSKLCPLGRALVALAPELDFDGENDGDNALNE